VTRPSKSTRDQALADLFAADPHAAVLRVLQRANGSMAAGEVKQALLATGVARIDADRGWRRAQRTLGTHEQVVVEKGYRYRWAARPEPVASQEALDGVRALAELAIEVEELIVNEASAAALIHRIRGRVKRAGLEPIERAGEETSFARARHKPIGRPIADGTPVIVVRPGYVWKGPDGDVLIAKAVVQE
jgi:hypothetical protein